MSDIICETFEKNKIPEYLQSTKLNQAQKQYLISIIEPLKKLGLGGIALLESNIQALVSFNKGHEFDSIKNILTYLGAECEKNPNFKSDMIGKLLIDITGESKNPFDISDRNIESGKTLGILAISILIYLGVVTLTGSIAASAISGAVYNYMKQELIDGTKTIDPLEILISGTVSVVLCGAFAVGQSVIRTGITQGMTKELAKEAGRKAFTQELGPIAQGIKQETKDTITKLFGNPIDTSFKKKITEIKITEILKRIINDLGEERIDTQIIQPYVIPIIK